MRQSRRPHHVFERFAVRYFINKMSGNANNTAVEHVGARSIMRELRRHEIAGRSLPHRRKARQLNSDVPTQVRLTTTALHKSGKRFNTGYTPKAFANSRGS